MAPSAASVAPVRLALIGAGQRGTEVYGAFALARPDLARFVAVAEPDEARRTRFAVSHEIPSAAAVADWPALLEAPDRVDAIVIATPDRQHRNPTIAALRRGHHVLLEKPIGPEPEDVEAIAAAAATSAGSLTIAHPLRYTPFFSEIASLLRAGSIGELVEVDWLENVGWWHFAHSYVRGNWRREALSSPLILAKTCHDLDVLRWLADAPCTSVASFGSLRQFRAEQAPAGAPERCLDGCPVAAECPFYAPRFYEPLLARGGWPVSVVLAALPTPQDASPRAALDVALRTGPYGRCVYRCDNDVPDHQATILEFANDVTATLTVTAFTAENTRTLKLMGTRGEIRGHMERGEIEIRRFAEAGGSAIPEPERVVVPSGAGHGGGDEAMLEAFVARLVAVRARRLPDASPTSLAVSLDSHRMAFAAERSRHERIVARP
jgi:predicted dehydrogenase